MPETKKEHFIYTLLMVTVMVGVMMTLNIVLENESWIEGLKLSLISFPLTYVVAVCLEWFFVGKVGMMLAQKLMRENDSEIVKGMKIALVFVTFMATIMSFYGSVMSVGFSDELLRTWLAKIPLNIVVAFVLQVAVARPIVGNIFRKIFPVEPVRVKVRAKK